MQIVDYNDIIVIFFLLLSHNYKSLFYERIIDFSSSVYFRILWPVISELVDSNGQIFSVYKLSKDIKYTK